MENRIAFFDVILHVSAIRCTECVEIDTNSDEHHSWFSTSVTVHTMAVMHIALQCIHDQPTDI